MTALVGWGGAARLPDGIFVSSAVAALGFFKRSRRNRGQTTVSRLLLQRLPVGHVIEHKGNFGALVVQGSLTGGIQAGAAGGGGVGHDALSWGLESYGK